MQYIYWNHFLDIRVIDLTFSWEVTLHSKQNYLKWDKYVELTESDADICKIPFDHQLDKR